MQLTISSNSVSNPQTIDLSNYIDVATADPANPAFSEKIFSRALLKEGGVLALESFNLRELVFPLKLHAATSTAMIAIEQQINQIINTPGATASWQDDGLSQSTTFDLQTGQFDVEYNYRASQQHWLLGKLRLFGQPFGRTPSPRVFAAASGVGPLLMISPYASGGANILGASGAGFGGQQQPSGGVLYAGNPSLAGDAPTMLQIGYAGPVPNGAQPFGVIPYVAVSVLPDQNYQPLITASQVRFHTNAARSQTAGAVGSQYIALHTITDLYTFNPTFGASAVEPTSLWATNHRLFAIARASVNPGFMTTQGNPVTPFSTTATVNTGDWGIYDLGVVSLRANEPPQSAVNVAVNAASAYVDLTAFVMLPDNSTWFFNPTAVAASQYGYPPALSLAAGIPSAPYTNAFVIDDFLTGDQFLYAGQTQVGFAPSPAGSIPSAARITSFGRGLVPRPQPYNGVPIIAILGVAQNSTPSTLIPAYGGASTQAAAIGGAWLNPQNLRTMAQINVIERSRYVLP